MTGHLLVAVRVIARGRVQGVGFRDATRRRGRDAGLVGWVRNLPDGSVEAVLQGSRPDVDTVVDWMRAGGPPAGRVDGLDLDTAAVNAALHTFDVIP